MRIAGKRLICLFLCIHIFTISCTHLSSEDMSCALEGKLYAGEVETGATRTDIEYYENQTTVYTSPEYVSTCRSPETEEEKVKVKEMKSETKKVGVIFFTTFGIGAAVLSAVLSGFVFGWF